MRFFISGYLALIILTGCSSTGDGTEQAYEDCPNYRSFESIRSNIEIKKAGLFLVYKNALRENPELRGKIVFQFSITPDGMIEDLSIKETEFANEEFNQALSDKFKAISFAKEEVCTRRLSYTFYFVSKQNV